MHKIFQEESELLNCLDLTQKYIGYCTDGSKLSPTSTFKSYLSIAQNTQRSPYIPIFIFIDMNISEYPDIIKLLNECELKSYYLLHKDNEHSQLNLKELEGLGLIFCTEHFNRTQHQLPDNTKLATSVHVRTDTWAYKNSLLYFFFNNFEQYNNRVRSHPINMFDYHFVDNRIKIEELNFLQKLYTAIADPEKPANTNTMKLCLGYLRGEAYNISQPKTPENIILFAPGGSANELSTKEILEEDFAEALCKTFPTYKIWMRTAPWNKSKHYLAQLNNKLSKYSNFVCNEDTHSDNIAEVYSQATILVTDWSFNSKSFTLSQQRPNIRCASTANPLPGTILTRSLEEAIRTIQQVLQDVQGYGQKLYQELLTEMRPVGGTIQYITENIDTFFSGTVTQDVLEYTPQDATTKINYSDHSLLDRFINFAISNGDREFTVDQKFYTICERISKTYPTEHPYNSWLLKCMQSQLFNWMNDDSKYIIYYKIFLTKAYFFAGDIQQGVNTFLEAYRLNPKIAVNPEWLPNSWSKNELEHFIKIFLNKSNTWDLARYQRLCQTLLNIISKTKDDTQLKELLTALSQ